MIAFDTKPYRLLIADDDAQFRAVLRSLLEPFFTLLEASSGEAAIEIVEDERVDLLLLDHLDCILMRCPKPDEPGTCAAILEYRLSNAYPVRQCGSKRKYLQKRAVVVQQQRNVGE